MTAYKSSITEIETFIKDLPEFIEVSTRAKSCIRKVNSLTRSIALEVAKFGITVNCIAPGPTQTGWIDEELEKAVVPIIPLGQLIQPEDIAETILFLSGKQAKMITGQVIKVSGGHAL